MALPSVSSTAVLARGLCADAGPHLDAMHLEPSRRVFGEVRREGRQDTLAYSTREDADLVLLDVGIVFQRAADQLVHLCDGFRPREAGSRHDEGEELC